MALSYSERQEMLAMLNNMSNQRAIAVLSSEKSFLKWLKNTAKWLWKKIKDTFPTYIFESFRWLCSANKCY